MTAVSFTMMMTMAVTVAVIKRAVPLEARDPHEASSATENVLVQRVAT